MQYARYATNVGAAVQGIGSSLYLTTITLTTVGYGDVLPNTDGGNVVCLITAVWGGFIASLLVLVVSNVFELTDTQVQAVAQIKLNRAAARSIMHGMRYFVMRKKQFIYQMKQDAGVINRSKVLQMVLSQCERREEQIGSQKSKYEEYKDLESKVSLLEIIKYHQQRSKSSDNKVKDMEEELKYE